MLMYAMGALVGIAIVGIAAVTRVKSEHRIRSSIRSDDQVGSISHVCPCTVVRCVAGRHSSLQYY